jgi:hypothetical protein
MIISCPRLLCPHVFRHVIGQMPGHRICHMHRRLEPMVGSENEFRPKGLAPTYLIPRSETRNALHHIYCNQSRTYVSLHPHPHTTQRQFRGKSAVRRRSSIAKPAASFVYHVSDIRWQEHSHLGQILTRCGGPLLSGYPLFMTLGTLSQKS